MFERIGRSIELFRTSWGILMEDKKLLVFPLLSGIISLIVLATFIIPLVIGQVMGGLFSYAILVIFYLVSYFVVIFFLHRAHQLRECPAAGRGDVVW